MAYRRDPITAPRLSGTPLRVFVEALESPVVGARLIQKLTHDSGLERFRQTSAHGAPPLSHPLPHPVRTPGGPAPTPHELAAEVMQAPVGPRAPEQWETIARFAEAYRSGRLSPSDVALQISDAVAANRDLGCFIAHDPDDLRAQAEASARRLRSGAPLSVLDGVPIAVKDELDQTPYPTTVGTSFLGGSGATEDATLVARLRAAGALLIGKTNMHEIGINPIGLNPHHGPTRNPWAPERISGGSSSGSAAAVAAGFCPVAIGADGGGSIRIPSGLCGVVGLKATWGRISERGVFPLCWHVGHVGPIGATVQDVAAVYAVIAGPDPRDAATLAQPPVELEDWTRTDLRGVRLGLHRAWFEDADPEVVRACEHALQSCVQQGARVVEIPAPDLNTLLWSHAIIILSEMATSMLPHTEEDRRRFGLDVRTNLAIARSFTSTDYVHALRHRHRLTRDLLELMHSVDAIVTPTTATTAPNIPEAALPHGESNLVLTDGLMRFIRTANLTGFPALAVPAGYDARGLPISLHFMGRPWEESLLLRLGRVVEQHTERRVPARHTQLLRSRGI